MRKRAAVTARQAGAVSAAKKERWRGSIAFLALKTKLLF